MQQWPTTGQIEYITRTVLGHLERFRAGDNIGHGHKWADWLHHLAVPEVPHTSQSGTKSVMAPKWMGCLHQAFCFGGSNTSARGW